MPPSTPRIAGVSTTVAVLLLMTQTGALAGMRIERVGQEEGPMPDVVTTLCRDRSGLVWNRLARRAEAVRR